jgi:hypothetical protein
VSRNKTTEDRLAAAEAAARRQAAWAVAREYPGLLFHVDLLPLVWDRMRAVCRRYITDADTFAHFTADILAEVPEAAFGEYEKLEGLDDAENRR